MKEAKKEIKSSSKPKSTVKSKKEIPEKAEQTPVLEIKAHSDEDHEILQLLGKKSNSKPKTHDIDYIPELERGDFDTIES